MNQDRYPPYRSLADVAAIERVPFAQRVANWNFNATLEAGCMRYPDKTALHYICDGDPATKPRTLRYRDLAQQARQAANLFASCGVGETGVVLFVLPVVPELYIGLLGAFASAIAFPVNWMLRAEHIAALARSVDTRVIVALGPTPGFDIWQGLQTAHDVLPAGTRLFSVPDPGGRIDPATDFATHLAAQPCDRADAPQRTGADDIVAYVHSGGTTGLPKVVSLANRGLVYRHWVTNHTLAHTPDEVIVADTPLFHIGGLMMRGLTPVANGNTIVIPSPLGARDRTYMANYWKFVETYKISRLSGVPTTLSMLLKNPPSDADTSSLKPCFATGSTPVPVAIHKGVEEMLGVRPLVMYGMTENTGNITLDPRDGPTKYGSAGLRLPYVDIRSVQLGPANEILRDSAPGENGMIVYRSPGVTPGYVDPRHNAAAFSDGWLISGDLGRIDADGYVWLTGRAKDVIIRGGHNIDPSVIEEALLQSPDVALAAAVAMPDAHAGEVPVAYVQRSAGTTIDAPALLEFVRERIAERPALPRDIFFLDEMPLTAVGKPRKNLLRDDAAKRAITVALASIARTVPLTVMVGDDPVHGTLARICAAPLSTYNRAELSAQIAAALEPFALAWRIDWPEESL